MKQYSVEYKEQILKEVEETGSVIIVARKHVIPSSTIHTWLKALKSSTLRSKAQEDRVSQQRLRDLELENQILKELLKKTHQVWLKG